MDTSVHSLGGYMHFTSPVYVSKISKLFLSYRIYACTTVLDSVKRVSKEIIEINSPTSNGWEL